MVTEQRGVVTEIERLARFPKKIYIKQRLFATGVRPVPSKQCKSQKKNDAGGEVACILSRLQCICDHHPPKQNLVTTSGVEDANCAT